MRYTVQVKLNKDFVEVDGGKITVGVKAKPKEGRANEELTKKLARHFGVSAGSVRIVSGRTSKKKVVDIG